MNPSFPTNKRPILTWIRSSRLFKPLAASCGLLFLSQLFFAAPALALTGGPSQPEVESFAPVGTTDMVDLATGDFRYNIPLLDVGGYPINMIYNAGASMDEESSWVGLGWNINPGAITRQMRGLPDDFDGDLVTKETYLKPNWTVGVQLTPEVEIFGQDAKIRKLLEKLGDNGLGGYSLGITYNNYNGVGISQSIQVSGNAGPLDAGLGLTASQDGLDLKPTVSFDKRLRWNEDQAAFLTKNVGVSINSRGGLKALNIGYKAKGRVGVKGKSKAMGKISLSKATYVPKIDFPRSSASVSFGFKTGFSLFGGDGEIAIQGSFDHQKLKYFKKDIPGYGYLNSDKASLDYGLLDFNRENDGPFINKVTKHLPLTNHSYDVFSIAGQGTGGMFRPHRGNVGHVHDSRTLSTAEGGHIPLDAEGGNAADLGFDLRLNTSTSTSGNWTNDNPALAKLSFEASKKNDLYEGAYFKMAGETAVDDDNLFEEMGGYQPVMVPIKNAGGWKVETEKYLRDQDNMTYNGGLNKTKRGSRAKRNQLIQTLTQEEAKQFGVVPSRYNNLPGKDHHLAEITVLRTDGARYVYGQPAYNKVQREVSFNISDKDVPNYNNGDCTTGLVSYSAGNDNTTENGNGKNEFFSATELPPYAHSYMLTELLSADYVDVDGNGPTANDLGAYTQFHYTTVSDYNWRVPYVANTANFSAGLYSDYEDDVASYIWGEKDLHYLNKIETKTHVAIFELTDRADAYGVLGENGGGSTTHRMKKLKKISLYAKPEYDADPVNAVPIKEVHFEYDYSLMPGVPNNPLIDEHSDPGIQDVDGFENQGGKLTLKKVWFTYKNSNRGAFSPYSFTYDTPGVGYNMKAYDIWGTYKDNSSADCDPNGSNLSNPEFPYVDQDQATTDANATAWNLTEIALPSGGVLKVDYESDDYAYVQDRKAMQMFMVEGCLADNGYGEPDFDPNDIGNPNNDWDKLYTDKTEPEQRHYLVFRSGSANTDELVYEQYLEDVYKKDKKLMYYRFLVELGEGLHDYVTGYGEIEDYGFLSNDGGINRAWIKLKPAKRSDRNGAPEVQAISRSSWNFTRIQNPKLAFNLPNQFPAPGTSGNGIKNVAKTLVSASIINQLINFIKGPNKTMQDQFFASEFNPDKSWIRLMNPTRCKLGGGHRVKSIKLYNNWDQMTTTGYGLEHGQEYSYRSADDKSYGVATYEPEQSKENPFVQPTFMKKKNLLAPDDRHYLEKPLGRTFYPAPQVTYSKVTVKDLTAPQLKRGGSTINLTNKTGKTVHEFYTTKDYPTISRFVPIKALRKALLGGYNPVKAFDQDFMTASQGYVVINNDMNGRAKAQWIYGEGKDEPISGMEYLYTPNATFTDPMQDDPFEDLDVQAGELNNACVVIDPSGEVRNKTIGVDYDVVVDFREQETENIGFGANAGLSTFLAGIIPGIVPSVWPTASYSKTRFRSAVVTKVVNRTGILREVVSHDLGASVATRNLAWDTETGEVLLTETQNEYGDLTYNFNLPAHWAYSEMAQAYKNIGLMEDLTANANGLITSGGATLVPGDEVYLGSPAANQKAWVIDDQAGDLYLIKEDGSTWDLSSSGTVTATTIRSGYRNLATSSVGNLVMKTNPIDPNNSGTLQNLDVNTFVTDLGAGMDAQILEASVTEYNDDWKTFPGTLECSGGEGNYTSTNTQSTLVGFIQEMINNQEITGVSTLNLSNYPSVSGFYSFNGCDFSNCPTLTITNLHALIPDQVLLNFDCSSGGCSNPNYLDLHIPVVSAGNDFTNIQSVAYDPTPHPQASSPVGQYFYLEGTWAGGVAQQIEVLRTTVWPLVDCAQPVQCGVMAGDVVNPYQNGVQGVWRPQKSYLYLGERQQQSDAVYASVGTDPNKDLDLREDGSYAVFTPFWNVPQPGNTWTKDATDWTWKGEVTNFSPYGAAIEERDPLYRYSAEVFGYAEKLPIAVGSNLRYNQLAFDGFEDYDFYDQGNCEIRHFAFEDHAGAISTAEAHTGYHSLELEPETSVSTSRALHSTLDDQSCMDGAYDNVPYTLKGCDLVGNWGPQTIFPAAEPQGNRQYVLGFWMKETSAATSPVFDYSSIEPQVIVNGSDLLAGVTPTKSNLIEGWQRYEYRFTIPSGSAGNIEVAFSNTAADKTCYLDDIRVHPFNSQMNSYVFDPVTLRLMATLDGNNYATLYEYNEEGQLMRQKRETERGIMTIKETRTHTHISQP